MDEKKKKRGYKTSLEKQVELVQNLTLFMQNHGVSKFRVGEVEIEFHPQMRQMNLPLTLDDKDEHDELMKQLQEKVTTEELLEKTKEAVREQDQDLLWST